MNLLPSTSTLFPYTTLFRSSVGGQRLAISRRLSVVLLDLQLEQGQMAVPLLLELFPYRATQVRSEEHTSELQSLTNLVCRLLLEKKKYNIPSTTYLLSKIIQ